MQEVLKAIFTSGSSIIILFVLSKLMGNRQIAQLTIFDYIVGITIGSIASEMAVGEWTDITKPLVAMGMYGLCSLLLSYLASKSLAFRRLVTGETLLLMDRGKIFRGNLKKAKLDLSELLTQIRGQGYFDLQEIETVILEPNGRISVLPKGDCQPLTPKDVGVIVQQKRPFVSLVLDGQILTDNLESMGRDLNWLKKSLHQQGFKRMHEVFLACFDGNHLQVYGMEDFPLSRDIFQ